MIQPITKPNGITLKDTDPVSCDKCKSQTFSEAMLMRRVSGILSGTGKTSYVPVPTFVCTSCGNVNDEFLPSELKPAKSSLVSA